MQHLTHTQRIAKRIRTKERQAASYILNGQHEQAQRLQRSIRRMRNWIEEHPTRADLIERCVRMLQQCHTPADFERVEAYIQRAENIYGSQMVTEQALRDKRADVNKYV